MTKSDKSLNIKELIKMGQAAKVKLYYDLLKRISGGQILKPTELRTLRELEVEIEGQNGEGKLPPFISTFDEAAEYCGVSKRTISYHLKRGNIRQEPEGSFKREVLDNWLKRHDERKGANKKSTEAHIKLAELRYRRARARREELIVGQLQGKLIPVDAVETAFSDRVYELSRSLQMLSRRIAHKVAGQSKKKMRDVASVIDIEVRGFMETYSRPLDTGKES